MLLFLYPLKRILHTFELDPKTLNRFQRQVNLYFLHIFFEQGVQYLQSNKELEGISSTKTPNIYYIQNYYVALHITARDNNPHDKHHINYSGANCQ